MINFKKHELVLVVSFLKHFLRIMLSVLVVTAYFTHTKRACSEIKMYVKIKFKNFEGTACSREFILVTLSRVDSEMFKTSDIRSLRLEFREVDAIVILILILIFQKRNNS